MDIEAAISKHNFGTPTAFKRGRDARWPYVPAVDYGDQGYDKMRTRQIKGKAFATRDEAIECARLSIERRKSVMRARLTDPRERALREWVGLPAELLSPQQ